MPHLVVDRSYCILCSRCCSDPGLTLPLLVIGHQSLSSQVCHILYQRQPHPLRHLPKKNWKKSDHTNFKLFWIAIRYRPTSLLDLLKDFSDTSLDCFRLNASSSPLLPSQEVHNCFGWLTGSISPRLFFLIQ
jgi:hypothetical protein